MKQIQKLALGGIPLIVLWLTVSTPTYGMFGFGIFSVVLGTIQNSIGLPASTLQKLEQAQSLFSQATVFPQAMVQTYRNFASQVSSTYRPWMNQVYSLPIQSTTLNSDSSLESLIHSGNASDLNSLSQSYTSVYGKVPVSTSAPVPYQEQTDALDSTAITSDGLSIKADQAATALLSQSQSLSSQAQSTAQGTATMVTAEAEALQLESLAIQHKELAAMLRNEASRVASIGSTMKQASIIANSNARSVSNVVNSRAGGN